MTRSDPRARAAPARLPGRRLRVLRRRAQPRGDHAAAAALPARHAGSDRDGPRDADPLPPARARPAGQLADGDQGVGAAAPLRRRAAQRAPTRCGTTRTPSRPTATRRSCATSCATASASGRSARSPTAARPARRRRDLRLPRAAGARADLTRPARPRRYCAHGEGAVEAAPPRSGARRLLRGALRVSAGREHRRRRPAA